MEADEILEVHRLLWRDEPPATIKYRGKSYSVQVLNTNSRQFRSVAMAQLLIVTQNLAKPTVNTAWVKAADGRALTWVFKNNNYVGKVTTEVRYVHDEKANIWTYHVYKLNPERIVHQVEEKEMVHGSSSE